MYPPWSSSSHLLPKYHMHMWVYGTDGNYLGKDHAHLISKHSGTSTLRPSVCDYPNKGSLFQGSQSHPHLERTPDSYRHSWQFWFHSSPLPIPNSHVLPRNTQNQTSFLRRVGGASSEPREQGRAEAALAHSDKVKREAWWPHTHTQFPRGQRTGPLVGSQTAGALRSDRDQAL